MTGTGIDYPTSRAILIGTSVYDDREFPPVPAVEHSLHGMYWALTEPSLGGWPPDRVTYRPNPRDSRSVIEDLREVARSTTGALIFYFAGHGTVAGPHSDLCLVLPDTPAKAADLYGLPIEMVRDAISQSRARTKIMILDCCYSGRAADKVLSPGTIHDIARLRGAYTLTASNLIEELARWSGNGAEPTSFTRELLEVIRTGLPGRRPFSGSMTCIRRCGGDSPRWTCQSPVPAALTGAAISPSRSTQPMVQTVRQPRSRPWQSRQPCPASRDLPSRGYSTRTGRHARRGH